MKKQISPLFFFVVLLGFGIAGYVLYENQQINLTDQKSTSEEVEGFDNHVTPSDFRLDIQNVSEKHPSMAGDQLHVRARVVVAETNKDVTDQDGIGVVISAYRTELIGDTVSAVDTAGLSGGAEYNYTNRLWVFNSSKFPPGKYRYDITAYCVRTDLACGSWKNPSSALQISNSYYFAVYPPTESQIVSISKGGDLNQILPINKQNQIFAFFTVNNLIQYTLVAHKAEFDVMFPVTEQDLLKDITIVDDEGNIITGPIHAVGAGYENQKQKIVFNNIELRPGNHIYYIRGTTPNKNTVFSISTTPADDWSVEFKEVPGTYADLGASATIFFEEVRVGM